MWNNYHITLMGEAFLMFHLIRKSALNPRGMVDLGQTWWGVGEVDSKVIGLLFNAKDNFSALIDTVLKLLSTTGLIEESSHLRAFARIAAICVKDKRKIKRKIFEFPEAKSTQIVTIKCFGTHWCSPIKPKGKIDIKETIASIFPIKRQG